MQRRCFFLVSCDVFTLWFNVHLNSSVLSLCILTQMTFLIYCLISITEHILSSSHFSEIIFVRIKFLKLPIASFNSLNIADKLTYHFSIKKKNRTFRVTPYPYPWMSWRWAQHPWPSITLQFFSKFCKGLFLCSINDFISVSCSISSSLS